MTVSLTTYPLKSPAAFAGMLADLSHADVISLRNTQAADIPFGIAVKAGADETKGALPSNMADKIRGIVISTQSVENASLAGANGVPDKQMMSVLRRGRIWAICEDGCVPEQAVFVRIAANGGNTQLGRLMGADDGANAGSLVGAVWKTTAAAGALAILEIDLTGLPGVLA